MRTEETQRIIADYTMQQSGALIIAIGALHGNEPAGVEAIRKVQVMLENEPRVNPDFRFRGRFVGLIGNLQAYQLGKRFIHQDLNRMWSKEYLDLAQHAHLEIEGELRELGALNSTLVQLIDQHQGDVLILDLHTTSAEGGVFTIALDGLPNSARIAQSLCAPVLKGLLKGLDGTLLHHWRSDHGKEITCVAFESGSHKDPISVDRAIAAIILGLRGMYCVSKEDVDQKHTALLEEYGKTLPKEVDLVYVHKIAKGDEFAMRPGYINFQPITQGEHLADDRNGPIYAMHSGRILMPLYQKQGTDGFFVVQP
jgi:succinylglutamate desuccinylase